jgi:hypothetical protein
MIYPVAGAIAHCTEFDTLLTHSLEKGSGNVGSKNAFRLSWLPCLTHKLSLNLGLSLSRGTVVALQNTPICISVELPFSAHTAFQKFHVAQFLELYVRCGRQQ